MDEIITEFTQVRQEWEAQEDTLISLLRRLKDAAADPSKSALPISSLCFLVRIDVKSIPSDLLQALKRQPEEWKGVHTHLSKFGKTIDKVSGLCNIRLSYANSLDRNSSMRRSPW